jgi:ferredoxin
MCPKSVFDADLEGNVSAARVSDCIDCEICERICPDLAIALIPAPAENEGAGAGAPSADTVHSDGRNAAGATGAQSSNRKERPRG